MRVDVNKQRWSYIYSFKHWRSIIFSYIICVSLFVRIRFHLTRRNIIQKQLKRQNKIHIHLTFVFIKQKLKLHTSSPSLPFCAMKTMKCRIAFYKMIDADIMHRNSITQRKSKMNLVKNIILVWYKYNFHFCRFL